jgi:hypothetical protein
MSRTCFALALALALLAVSAAAQDKDNAAPQTSTSISVNGQPVKGKVVEIDGKHFVAVEDLAQSLHGTISYGDGRIALTLPPVPTVALPPLAPQLPAMKSPQPPSPQSASVSAQAPPLQPPSTTSQQAETGGVKGTLTYFFSFHDGNKPDAGSKAWLVKGRAEIPTDQTFVGTNTTVGTSGNPGEYNAAKYSVADENGSFEMTDIPPGQYTLILQSAHTKGTLNEKRNFFGRGDGHTPRDSSGRVGFLNVTVKPGETVDASKDFGPTID